MTTLQELFYAKQLGNCILCTLILEFVSLILNSFFSAQLYDFNYSYLKESFTVIQFQAFLSNTNNYIIIIIIIIIIMSCHQHRYRWLSLSRHSSLSFIASGRSSGLHPVSLQSCYMLVRAGRPALARPCAGVHRENITSLLRVSAWAGAFSRIAVSSA